LWFGGRNLSDQLAKPVVTGMRVAALVPDQADIELFGQPGNADQRESICLTG
jgi:hypothetical protein